MDRKLRDSLILFVLLALSYLILRLFIYKLEGSYDVLSFMTLVSGALIALFTLSDRPWSALFSFQAYLISLVVTKILAINNVIFDAFIPAVVIVYLLVLAIGVIMDRFGIKMFHVKHKR